MNDALFKFVFGRPERKRITIDFLNTLLEGELETPIEDLTFMGTEKAGSSPKSKVTRFDVACRLGSGERVDIEVQVANEKNIVRRTLFYWARLYSDDLQEGEDYRQLKPAITINIVNFRLFEDDPAPFSSWSVTNLRTHRRINRDLSIHFLEIPKFTPRPGLSKIERWMAFFSNKLTLAQKEELTMQDTAIRDAIEVVDDFFENRSRRRRYLDREIVRMDQQSMLGSAYDDGVAEGLARGIEQGIEQGIEKGRTEVLQEVARRNRENIRNLLSLGLTPEGIASALGIPMPQVQAVASAG